MRVAAADRDPATPAFVASPDNPATAPEQESAAPRPGIVLANCEPDQQPPRASTMTAVRNLGILAGATAAAVLTGGALGLAIHSFLQGSL